MRRIQQESHRRNILAITLWYKSVLSWYYDILNPIWDKYIFDYSILSTILIYDNFNIKQKLYSSLIIVQYDEKWLENCDNFCINVSTNLLIKIDKLRKSGRLCD